THRAHRGDRQPRRHAQAAYRLRTGARRHQLNIRADAGFSAEGGRKGALALALQLVTSPTSTRSPSVYRSMRTKENGALNARATRSISSSVAGFGNTPGARGYVIEKSCS